MVPQSMYLCAICLWGLSNIEICMNKEHMEILLILCLSITADIRVDLGLSITTHVLIALCFTTFNYYPYPMLYIKCRIMEHKFFRAFACYLSEDSFNGFYGAIQLDGLTTLLEHQFVNALNTQSLVFLLEAFVDLESLSI